MSSFFVIDGISIGVAGPPISLATPMPGQQTFFEEPAIGNTVFDSTDPTIEPHTSHFRDEGVTNLMMALFGAAIDFLLFDFKLG